MTEADSPNQGMGRSACAEATRAEDGISGCAAVVTVLPKSVHQLRGPVLGRPKLHISS